MVHEQSYHYNASVILTAGIQIGGRLSGKTEEIKSFNTYLDAVQLKIYDIF